MSRFSLDKVIVAKRAGMYVALFKDVYTYLESMESLKTYILGVHIGCYCSGNFLDPNDWLQNGPDPDSDWYFIGKPLPDKKFKDLCDTVLGCDEYPEFS